jgi:hypothetical protein
MTSTAEICLRVAGALLRCAEQRARAHGARALALHRGEFMKSAIALYERFGFVRAPRFDTEFGAIFGVPTPRPLRVIAYVLDISGENGGDEREAPHVVRECRMGRRGGALDHSLGARVGRPR